MAKLPLAGVRVTDFTWIGAGSYCTKILADYGADVVKIESMKRLDSLRLTAPYKDRIKGVNRSGYFADRNTSKRSVTINMKDARGVEIVKKLIAQSDIVANNFTPDVMPKFGLGYEDVRKLKPDIIYLAMSMAGAAGPESKYLGYGASMGALTGLQNLMALPGREPVGTGTNFPDHIPNPCHAAFAVLCALRHRRLTGEGQFLDIAQTEPTVALLGPTILDLTVNGREQQAVGNDHPSVAPHNAYRCEGDDRWIVICAMDDAQWAALVAVLGSPDWAQDEVWQRVDTRYEHRQKLDALISAETATWKAEDLMLALQVKGVPAGLVQNAEDIVTRDLQLAHRGHWLKLDHPEMGKSIYNAGPFRSRRMPAGASRPAPLLGQHTQEVCAELLGLDAAEVADLQRSGVLA
jgi:benzylsuccinate CoA-transferase BbsF subunit